MAAMGKPETNVVRLPEGIGRTFAGVIVGTLLCDRELSLIPGRRVRARK